MFRLCEMWFALGGEAPVAAQFAAAAARVPSWKFLPLAYQLASRLARPGRHPDLDAAGFTVRARPTSSLVWHRALSVARHPPGKLPVVSQH